MEYWKDITGYEGLYEVSSFGNVRSTYLKGKNRRKHVSPVGYISFTLSKFGKQKKYLAHRLVANAFISNTSSHKQVNHKNGIKGDNYIENLEWCSALENRRHAIKHGLWNKSGELNGNSKLNVNSVREIRALYIKNNRFNRSKVARQYNVTNSLICQIVQNNIWTHV